MEKLGYTQRVGRGFFPSALFFFESDAMRKLASPLAALLSLLMATTSVSASVCDLSCCSHPAPICHAGASIAAPSASPAASASAHPKSHHCGNSIKTRTTAQREGSRKLELVAASSVDRSYNRSSCLQLTCRQPSASTSPSKANIAENILLDAMRMADPHHSYFSPGRFENPSLGLLTGHLLTTLRI